MNNNIRKDDVVSDPAKNDEVGSDWSAEGGSTPTGPATHTNQTDEEAEESKAKDQR